MTKIKGSNVRLYLGDDLLAHTNEVNINLDTDTEETTDAESGKWANNKPTLNRWNVDVSVWYHNATTNANFSDVMDAYLAQTALTLKCEIETGVDYSGSGYLTNLNPSGGTDAAYVQFTAAFIGDGELS